MSSLVCVQVQYLLLVEEKSQVLKILSKGCR